MSDPWDDIRPTDTPGKLHLRRAQAEHPLDLFRGRDHDGNYLFFFKGRFADAESIVLPDLANISMTLQQDEEARWQFTIRLLEKSHIDIFRALCADLMAATEDLDRGEDEAGVEIILARLRRWRDLLRVRHQRRLSDAQLIGLFGELLVLRDLLLRRLGPLEAVGAWRGPHGDEQDFLCGDWLIEVKTRLATSDSRLEISSENQLDSPTGQLLVCCQTLGLSARDAEGARHLNSLIREIDSFLLERSYLARDGFLGSLVECGYVDIPEYEATSWVLANRSWLRVSDGFPRLVAADLPAGVDRVQYSVVLDACKDFRVGEQEALLWVFGGD